MLLAIDVGNTYTVLGVYDGAKLSANWRMRTTKGKSSDETGIFILSLFEHSAIDHHMVDSIIISSVVPDVIYSIIQGVRKYFGINPILVEVGIKTGLNLKMENPREMGADRIVKMVAAHEIYKGDVIVIDYGTATTFDAVDSEGNFLTAITAPGIQISSEALFASAAQLPKTEIKNPRTVIAKNTITSIQAGLFYGLVGETVYIINKIRKEFASLDFKVVATGGFAGIISEEEKIFDVVDALLALKGLQIIYTKNQKRK